MIKEITEFEDINVVLNYYKNGNLRCFLYSISHKRILFRLEISDNNDIILILGIDCVKYNGLFDIDRVNLQVIHENGNMKLKDLNGEFEFSANKIVLLKGDLISDFGTDFQKKFMYFKG